MALHGIVLPIESRNQVPYVKDKSAVLSIEDTASQVDENNGSSYYPDLAPNDYCFLVDMKVILWGKEIWLK